MATQIYWPLPKKSWAYQLTMDWRLPLIVSIIYVTVITWLSRKVIAGKKKQQQKPEANSEEWSLLKLAIIAHNIALAAFSAKVFYETAPAIFFPHHKASTWFQWYCDANGATNDSVLKFWTWVFYLSKYYELLDTVILLVKGRPSSFLQTYHHAGAIWGMWLLSASKAYGSWVFVVFNSFIHTFMYTYYTLTCLGYRPSWKKLMTYMQITQFIFGLPLAFLYSAIPGCCPRQVADDDMLAIMLGITGYWSKFIAMLFNFLYVSYLVILFVDFARRSYFGHVKKVEPSAAGTRRNQTPSPKKLKSL